MSTQPPPTTEPSPAGPSTAADRSARPERPAARHPWAGTTAVVVGLVAAALAARGDLRPNADLRVQIVSALVILVAIAAWYGTAVVSDHRAAAIGRPVPGLGPRLPAGWLVGVAVLAAVRTWLGVAREVDGGVPGPVLPAVGTALVLVAVGGLLLAIGSRGRGDEPRPVVGGTGSGGRAGPARRLSSLAAMLTLVVGAGAVVVTPRLVEGLAVDATTASPLSSDEGLPTAPAPTGVAWTWERPDGAAIAYGDVVAAAPGVAVSTGDGIAVLDGATGEPRWHHRRDGAVVTTLASSPAGRWVTAVFRPAGDDWTGVRAITFDAATGEVGFDRLNDGGAVGNMNLQMTDAVVVGGDLDVGGHYEAFSLADGETLWTWEPPDGCEQPYVPRRIAAASTVIAVLLCGATDEAFDAGTAGEVVVVGLDDLTGREVWRHAEPDDWRRGVMPGVAIGPDGSAVLLSWSVDGRQDAAAERRVVLDAAEGAVVFDRELLDFDVERVDDSAASGVGGWNLRLPTAYVRRVVGSPDLQRLPATACASAGVTDTAAGHLVELCSTIDRDSRAFPVSVTVTPWDDGTPQPPFGFELAWSDGATDPLGVLRLEALPAATVVWAIGGRTLVGLG